MNSDNDSNISRNYSNSPNVSNVGSENNDNINRDENGDTLDSMVEECDYNDYCFGDDDVYDYCNDLITKDDENMHNNQVNNDLNTYNISPITKSNKGSVTNDELSKNVMFYSNKKIHFSDAFSEDYLIKINDNVDADAIFQNWAIRNDCNDFWSELDGTAQFKTLISEPGDLEKMYNATLVSFKKEMVEQCKFNDEYSNEDVKVEDLFVLLECSNLTQASIDELKKILTNIESFLLQADIKFDTRLFYSIVNMYKTLCDQGYKNDNYKGTRSIINKIKNSILDGIIYVYYDNGNIKKLNSVFQGSDDAAEKMKINNFISKTKKNEREKMLSKIETSSVFKEYMEKESEYLMKKGNGKISKTDALIMKIDDEIKLKVRITIDYMMIIGKYFKERRDYINVMKVAKIYQHLAGMYKSNPIDDSYPVDGAYFFPNVQTMNYYDVDFDQKLLDTRDAYKYVFWQPISSRRAYKIYKMYASNNGITKTDDMTLDLTLENSYKDVIDSTKGVENTRFSNLKKNIELKGKIYSDEYSTFVKFEDGVGYGSFFYGTKIISCVKDGYSFEGFHVSLIFPNTVTIIEECAFYDNQHIKQVTFPTSIISIGKKAFSMCSQLEFIDIKPYTIEEIPEECFYSTSITEITIPEGITKVGNFAFSGCTSLTNVKLPSTLEEIGKNAFSRTRIRTIIIPSNVSSIGDEAFVYCEGLTSFDIDDSNSDKLITIGEKVFLKCLNLRQLNFGYKHAIIKISTLKTIGFAGTVKINVTTAKFNSDGIDIKICKTLLDAGDLGMFNVLDPTVYEILGLNCESRLGSGIEVSVGTLNRIEDGLQEIYKTNPDYSF